jgi:isopentenyl-diphosphate delta-isomerase
VGFETVIATGGITSGLDVAKAIALGATCAGIARPVLRALVSGGRAAAEQLLDAVEGELRAAMFLAGARDLQSLKAVPRVVTGPLQAWMRPE